MKHTLVRSRAPLRLGLAGGGTDVSPYCDEHGGYVLNATIDRYAYVTLERIDGDEVEFVAADQDFRWRGPAQDPQPDDPRVALHAGVYRRFVRDFGGGRCVALRMISSADGPPGSGLGTSSAIVVAMAEAFRFLFDLPLGAYEVAHLAFEIERLDLALNGGRQDQYAAAFGGFNFMEFHRDDRVIINPLRVDRRVQNEIEASLVTYFTGVSRASASIIGEQTRNMQAGAPKSIEALHKLRRSAVEMKEAILRCRVADVAHLLEQSWIAKKQTAAGVSSDAIDHAYDIAKAAGAMGGKVSGAGGGGFMMFLCDPARRPDVVRALNALGGAASVCQFSERGAEAWRVR
jgi:D-glycero-alpha-D-manno-heptose-7-phosphate kinase